MPEISVIMPVFNSERYLKQSIESILNQTFNNFEFIIINDGSNDDSLKIIHYYMHIDKRIKLISRENRGLVYSLNEGIKMANAKYIARMDSDDISISKRFEEQIKVLSSSDIDILGTAIEAFGDIQSKDKLTLEKTFAKDINSLTKEQIEKNIFSECIIAHPTVMMKKEVFNSLKGYDYRFIEAEDYDLWFRAIKKGLRIGNINEKLLQYRVHSGSKTRKAGSNIKYNILAKLRYLNLLEKKGHKLRYLIWGASNGGKIAYEALSEYLGNGKNVAYIDKFKTGSFNGIDVLKPDEIKKLNFDYIFIATAPGKNEAEAFLNDIGYKFIDNYVYIL